MRCQWLHNMIHVPCSILLLIRSVALHTKSPEEKGKFVSFMDLCGQSGTIFTSGCPLRIFSSIWAAAPLFGYVIVSLFDMGKKPWKCFMFSRELDFLKKKKKSSDVSQPSLSPSEKVLKMWNVVGNYSECNKNVHVKKKSSSQPPWLEWCPRAGSSSAMLFGLSVVFSFQDHIPHSLPASRTLSHPHTHHINTQTHTALTYIYFYGTGYPQSLFSLLQSLGSPSAEQLPSLFPGLQLDTNIPKHSLFIGPVVLTTWSPHEPFLLSAYFIGINKNTIGKNWLFFFVV